MVTIEHAGRIGRADYYRGCAFVLLAGLIWSFGGVTVRLAEHADSFQYMIYRGIGQIAAMVLWGHIGGKPAGLRALVRAGPLLWLASLLVAFSAIAYVTALKTTLVANVMLLNASSPLWTAVLAAILLRERFDAGTMIAVALGTAGIVVMVHGDFSAGDLFGNALALGATFCFALYSICLRFAGSRDREPVVLGFGLVTLVVAAAVTLLHGRSLLVPPSDMLAGLIHGFAFIGIGMVLFVRSAGRVPAAELTILSQTETIFGPVWVWVVFGEVPPASTVLGGGIILAAIVIKAAAGARSPPPRIAD